MFVSKGVHYRFDFPIFIDDYYIEVRLIFDRCLAASLKEKTREKWTAGKEIKYRVSDKTNIVNILLKQFLSHIDIKAELTTYLPEKALGNFKNKSNTQFVVVHDAVAENNFETFPEALKTHTHLMKKQTDCASCIRSKEF